MAQGWTLQFFICGFLSLARQAAPAPESIFVAVRAVKPPAQRRSSRGAARNRPRRGRPGGASEISQADRRKVQPFEPTFPPPTRRGAGASIGEAIGVELGLDILRRTI